MTAPAATSAVVERRPLTLEDALKITSAICQRSFYFMGLHEGALDSLEGVPLIQMLEACSIVNRANDKASKAGGAYTLHTVPDERLVAATFALEHYAPGAIVAIPNPHPDAHPGTNLVIGVFAKGPAK